MDKNNKKTPSETKAFPIKWLPWNKTMRETAGFLATAAILGTTICYGFCALAEYIVVQISFLF